MSVFIIAEAGVNHNGSMKVAKELISVAVKAGADAVKFQTFRADTLVSKSAEKADYQKDNTGNSESQYAMLKRLELNEENHIELIEYCQNLGIIFLSTPFDLESISLLHKLGLNTFKIPSGEITNLPYLQKIGSLNKKVILSTGMSNMQEIGEALSILVNAGTPKDNITVLHANTMYPTPYHDVNLNAMVSIGETYNVKYGYSDHTLGIEVDIASVALGATVIEKHFTLDKTMDGPDHKASLEPYELINMVKSIRNIELALGSKLKEVTPSERPNMEIARKSLTAATDIKKGETFTLQNIAIKRPGNGISPMLLNDVLGTIADKDYVEDSLI